MGYMTKEMIIRNCLAIENLFSKNVPKVTILKYILALLSIKKASDLSREAHQIWDEIDETGEYSENLKKIGEKNIVLHHDFLVPETAYWNNIIQTELKIGDTLNRGFLDLIKNNKDRPCFLPFSHIDSDTIDFNSKLLGNQSEKERLLTDALHLISDLNLGNQDLNTQEDLDDAVDAIINHFIIQHPEFFITPDSVTKLMIGLSELESNHILVPEAGEGKIIRQITDNVTIPGIPKRKLPFKVVIPDKCLFFVTCMRAFLCEYVHLEIILGTISLESGLERNKLQNKILDHTHVLGSIPLETQKRTETEQEYIEGGPFSYGIPLNKKSEFSSLLGMWKYTVSGGKLVAAVPPQILYKERSEGQIRKNLITDDFIEAVIQLSPKLYLQNQAAYAVLIMRQFKTQERKKKILFIDAGKVFVEGKKQNTLSDEMIQEILIIYKNFKTVEGKSKVATMKDVMECDYSLDVSRYVNPIKREKDEINLMEKLNGLKRSSSEKSNLIDLMINSLTNLENLHQNVKSR